MNESEENLYHENIPNLGDVIVNKANKIFRMKTIHRCFPILNWLPNYRFRFLLQDLVAGFTVGLTTIPQAIAYGVVAGLPPQYGLYSAFMGCFVYIFFGSCKDVTVGPTAIMALMVQIHVSTSPDFAILACFLSGCVMTTLGLLNLGVLVQFISIPVTTGFTMAAAITIASGQINNLFGIPSKSNEFLESWRTFFKHIGNSIKINDSILGISTLIMLTAMKKVKDIEFQNKNIAKYISLSRNALAIIIGSLLAYFLSKNGSEPFRLSGKISPGLPSFQLPPFSTKVNGTVITFSDMISELGPSIFTIPLIAILETIAIAKAFSKGKIVDASQEMIAVGISNVMGSFVSSMPVTGSFTRTAINNASGVKTPLGGAVTGLIVLMALAFLTRAFYYIPKATLAALIISAMINMMKYETAIEIWKSKKFDIMPFIVSLITCLIWGLEYGMMCGIFVNMLFILYGSARPQILISKIKLNGIEVGLVELHGKLGYASAEYLKAKVVKFVSIQNNPLALVVINGEDIYSIDSTIAMNIISLQEDLKLLNCDMICWNWQFKAAGVVCRLNELAKNMFKFGKNMQESIAMYLEEIPKNNINLTLVM